LSILDDHSRFAVGLHALDHPRVVFVIEWLAYTFEKYGVPQAMLMDHGIPRRKAKWSGSTGLSRHI